MSLEKSIPAVLRQARVSKGISVFGLAELAGLSDGYMSQVETGKRGFSFDTFEAICEALEIKPSTIIRRAEK